MNTTTDKLAEALREALPILQAATLQYPDAKAKRDAAALALAEYDAQRGRLKADTLTISGRRWFHRTQGNTYFSCVVSLNGAEVARIPYAYGYGDQYAQAGFHAAVDAGAIPPLLKYDNGMSESRSDWSARTGIKVIESAADVARKRDL